MNYYGNGTDKYVPWTTLEIPPLSGVPVFQLHLKIATVGV